MIKWPLCEMSDCCAFATHSKSNPFAAQRFRCAVCVNESRIASSWTRIAVTASGDPLTQTGPIVSAHGFAVSQQQAIAATQGAASGSCGHDAIFRSSGPCLKCTLEAAQQFLNKQLQAAMSHSWIQDPDTMISICANCGWAKLLAANQPCTGSAPQVYSNGQWTKHDSGETTNPYGQPATPARTWKHGYCNECDRELVPDLDRNAAQGFCSGCKR